jgi:glycosyltransferase involved in cell wall biosynthesis
VNILLIEPYFTGSHKQWAVGFAEHSKHDVRFLTMKGQFWKWRMHGGAVTMAREFNNLTWRPDLILATDMLDLSTFLALTKSKSYGIPTAIYFHENQLSYPWSPKDRDVQNNRDTHYGFINYASALAADQVFFNSEFHMASFLDAIPPFLQKFPDYRELDSVNVIRGKSRILHLGMDLRQFDNHRTDRGDVPLILWNHRWQYDKNPNEFFNVLEKVREYGNNFKLAIMGENFNQYPDIFIEAQKSFEDQIVQWGYAESFTEYAQWLWKADILPVTSNQEFFGVSVMEAMYCDTWPLLPNRLTYPELLPPEQHQDHLYSNGQDLFNKINWAIENYEQIKSLHFHSIAKPFDWEYMAPIYDSAMEQV